MMMQNSSKPDFFEKFDEDGETKRILSGWNLKLVAGVAIAWDFVSIMGTQVPFLLFLTLGQFYLMCLLELFI